MSRILHQLRKGRLWATLLAVGLLTSQARAGIVVTGTDNAIALSKALTANAPGGFILTGANLVSGHKKLGGEISSGTFGITGPTPSTYGWSQGGIVLSTGDATDYGSGPNVDMMRSTEYGSFAGAAQTALLNPIGGGGFGYWDVTQLDIMFDAGPNLTNLMLKFVFGTEEWFSKTNFASDGFGVYLNGVNQAIVDGMPVSTSHPGMTLVPHPPDTTELNGVLISAGMPLILLNIPVIAGSTGNKLTLIIGDRLSDVVDSTAYISLMVPEPSSWALMSMGALAAAAVAYRRRRAAN